jgi:hypothetical protein
LHQGFPTGTVSVACPILGTGPYMMVRSFLFPLSEKGWFSFSQSRNKWVTQFFEQAVNVWGSTFSKLSLQFPAYLVGIMREGNEFAGAKVSSDIVE